MSEKVQRFIVEAFPASDHPTLYPFQLHTVVIFVGEDDREKALGRAEAALSKRKWKLVKYLDKGTLIEDRVRENQNKEIWNAYIKAKAGSVFIKVEPKQKMLSKEFDMNVPKIDERFFDKVIIEAGGHRLTEEEANFSRTRNADYKIDTWIIELKALEEERLLKPEHQENLAKIFSNYAAEDDIELDYTVLDQEDQKRYFESVGVPVQRALASASKQIRATKEFLNLPAAKGAVIILNNGYGSLPPHLLYPLAKKFSLSHPLLNEVISVSTWLETDGFDRNPQFVFQPKETSDPVLLKITKAFWNNVEILMTEFMRGGCEQIGAALGPTSPVIFKINNKWFRFVSSIPASSIFEED